MTIAAEDLARMESVMVYPAKRWWANDRRKLEQEARYSLIATRQKPTLYITPVVYIYFEHLQQWIDSRRRRHAVPLATVDEDATLLMPPRGAPFPSGPHGPEA